MRINNLSMQARIWKKELDKVDQLTAMQWCIAPWNKISADSIYNCFSFNGIFADDHATDEKFMNETDELDSDLTATLRKLPIRKRDRMSTEEMISLPTESEIVSYDVTDEEILLSATSTDDGNDEFQEKDSIEAPSHSTKTKLESIAGDFRSA